MFWILVYFLLTNRIAQVIDEIQFYLKAPAVQNIDPEEQEIMSKVFRPWEVVNEKHRKQVSYSCT